jgi:hypothetical protein
MAAASPTKRKRASVPSDSLAALRPSIMLFGDSITQYSFNPALCGWVRGSPLISAQNNS